MPDRAGLRNEIIITVQPQGVFFEGLLHTGSTPLPGTCMKLNSTNDYSPGTGGADGSDQPVIILLPDRLQGGTCTQVYADSSRAFFYVPQPGEVFQLLVKNLSGTGDTVAVGALYGIEASSGKLIANSSFAQPCFQCIEAHVALTADTLCLFRYAP